MPCAVALVAGLVSTPDTSTSILPHHQHPQQRKHTGQIAHSAHARNATPSAKMAISFRFRHDAALVFSRRSSRPPCLIHHSPPVGRAISVCRRKRRQIAICGRFRSRAVRFVAAGCYPNNGTATWYASWPGSQDGQRMSQTISPTRCNWLGTATGFLPIQTMPMRLFCG